MLDRTKDYIDQEISKYINYRNSYPAELHIGISQYYALIEAYEFATYAYRTYATGSLIYRGIRIIRHADKFSYFALVGGEETKVYTGETIRLE